MRGEKQVSITVVACRKAKSYPLGAMLSYVGIYSGLAVLVLIAHVIFILWVVFGAFLVGSRPVLRWLHIASLVWSILVQILYWPCPLTLLETWFEQKAGVEPYQGGFLLHYLDKLVYPDIPAAVLTGAAVVVCGLNFAYYARRLWMAYGSNTHD